MGKQKDAPVVEPDVTQEQEPVDAPAPAIPMPMPVYEDGADGLLEDTDDTKQLLEQYDFDEPGDVAGSDDDTVVDDSDGKEPSEDDTGSKEPSGDTPAGPDEALVTRALRAGFTEAEIALFSPDELTEAVDAVVGTDDRKKAAIDAAKARFKDQAPPAPDLDLTLDPEEYDPDLVAKWDKLTKFVTQENATLKAELKQLRAAANDAVTKDLETRFDRSVKDLGEDWEDVLGKGNISDLRPNSPEYKARVEILEQMDVLVAGYKNTGRQLPSKDALFRVAVQAAHGDKGLKIARNEVRRKVQSRQNAATIKPTDRTSADHRSPDQAANDWVARKLREFGVTD